jgi:CBS domain-containing protein
LIVAGVPGSGKSWVLDRLVGLATVVRNDDFLDPERLAAAITAAAASGKAVVADIPFGERKLMARLGARGVAAELVFIVEAPDVIAARLTGRDGKPPASGVLTRAARMAETARGYGAFHGTAGQVLHYLKARLGSRGAVPLPKVIEMTPLFTEDDESSV